MLMRIPCSCFLLFELLWIILNPFWKLQDPPVIFTDHPDWIRIPIRMYHIDVSTIGHFEVGTCSGLCWFVDLLFFISMGFPTQKKCKENFSTLLLKLRHTKQCGMADSCGCHYELCVGREHAQFCVCS